MKPIKQNTYKVINTDSSCITLLKSEIYNQLSDFYPSKNIYPILRALYFLKRGIFLVFVILLSCDCPKCPEPIIPDTIYVDTFYYARIDSAKEVAIKEATAFRDSIRSEFIIWVEKMRGTKIYNNIVVSSDSTSQILCN